MAITRKRILRSWFALVFGGFFIAVQPTEAADNDGRFMTGGGIGSVSCPDFLDAMALARQRGGVGSSGGTAVIHQFVQYILGFQTGYNYAAKGVFDVFAPLEKDVGHRALFMIEAWCGRNPAANFDHGLFDLLTSLRRSAKERIK